MFQIGIIFHRSSSETHLKSSTETLLNPGRSSRASSICKQEAKTSISKTICYYLQKKYFLYILQIAGDSLFELN